MFRVLTSLTIAAGLLITAACGGSHGLVAPGAEVTLFQPSVLYSNGSAQLRLLGRGFGARKSVVDIKFTATSGTPFANGTSSTFMTTGIVDSDVQIRGTVPPSFVNANIDASVDVILPSGSTISSDGPVASFIKQEVLSITPTSVSSGAQPAFEITGLGFQPPLALVTVRFDAVVGTPFGAGASSSITTIGTVNTDTSITGLLPDGQVAFDTDASVTVILPDGASISSSGPLIHWVPVPTVASFAPGTIPGGTVLPYIMTGTAYGPVSGTAQVTLEATVGTPFFGGTTSTITFPGTIDSPTQISGFTPSLNPSTTGLAYVRVTLPGGATAVSITPLVQFLPPPTITGFTPGTVQSGNSNPWKTLAANTTFSIAGTNFGPNGVVPTIVFTATSGTPFNNGTSATFTATGSVTSPSNIAGNFPDPKASVGTTGSFVVTWPNGASAASAANIFTVALAPPVALPVWETSAISGGLPASDDSTHSVSFASGFSFPFYGNSYTGCNVNANGSLTFGGGDTSFQPSAATFTGGLPRVSSWWRDLLPNSSTLFFNTSAFTGRAYTTWNNSSTYSGNINMQIGLYANGRIDFRYLSMADTGSGIVGISRGGNQGTPVVTDWSQVNWTACANLAQNVTAYEQTSNTDLANDWLLLYPDGSGGYDWASGP